LPPPPLYGPERSGVTPPVRRWRDGLLHVLLPAPCLKCGEPLPAKAPLGLCAACRARLAPLPLEACAVCAGLLDAFEPPPGYRCGACRERPPAYERLLALWLYRDPLDAVIQALKFGRLDYLGRHLAVALEEGLGGRLGGFDAIVPVPLHWWRRISRGYNQAERIARPLAAYIGVPLLPALRRSRPTRAQTSLGRTARAANLRNAFRVPRPGRVQGLRLLLVDDVATTGATLDAAAAALIRAGADDVSAVVAGKTPL
jgi:ComF family protein